MARVTTRKGWVRKLDKLVGDIVKARDKRCIVCGTTSNLTPGHLFSRIAYSTRWDLENCYAQCRDCNFRHESDPYPMMEAVRQLGEPFGLHAIEALHRKYVTPVKYKTYQLEELYASLLSVWEKVK